MSLLQESVIHVDETVLPLLHPLKTINARAWAYVGAASKLVFYEFTTNTFLFVCFAKAKQERRAC